MCFKMIYWTPISGSYFLKGSILEKCGIFLKNCVFPGGYGRIGEILTGGYGRIGVYRVKTMFITCMYFSAFYTVGFVLSKS